MNATELLRQYFAERERTAYHEAGHLVAHILYGGSFIDRMTIQPRPEAMGEVSTGAQFFPPIASLAGHLVAFFEQGLKDRIKENVAGIVAQRYIDPTCAPVNGQGDKERAGRLLAMALGDDATPERIESEWAEAEAAVGADFARLGGAEFFARVTDAILRADQDACDWDEEVWIDGDEMCALWEHIEGLVGREEIDALRDRNAGLIEKDAATGDASAARSEGGEG